MNTCKICGAKINPKRIYCSNACKFADSELNATRAIKIKNDPTKAAKCKIDGKILNDEKNLGGHLSSYSKNFLNKPFDWNDWEIIDRPVNDVPHWICPHCDKTFKCNGLDAGGWIGNHLLKDHNISKIEHVNQFPSDAGLWPHKLKLAERTIELQTKEESRVECLECHQFFKKISNSHLLQKHEMTMDEYKLRHPFAKVNSQELTNRNREKYFSDTGLSKVNPESTGETEIKEFINNLGITASKFRTGFYEIDIYVESMKIGFEFHGLFHHSQFRGKHYKHTHRDKLEMVERDGIHLIQIFEDEWKNKQSIVKSRIKNILGLNENTIYARKCKIVELTNKEIKPFLEENHLQGYDAATISVALEFNNKIVQCMTFEHINKRTNGMKVYDTGIFENVRSCSKIDTNVVGGFERILNYFEEKYNPKQIVSFADRNWSSMLKNPVYLRLGFEFIGKTNPAFYGMRGYTNRLHRANFTKEKLKVKFSDIFKDVDLTTITQEAMIKDAGYDIIWNSGNLKFVKTYIQPESIPENTINEEDIETNYLAFVNRNRLFILDSTKPDKIIKCQLCPNDEYFYINGFSTHLKYKHQINNNDYIKQFGEFRPSHLKNK